LIGSGFTPYGTAIGAGIGALAGGIGGYFQASGQRAQEEALASARQKIAEERRRQYQMRMDALQKAMEMYGPMQQWAAQVTGIPAAPNPFASGTPASSYFTPDKIGG
jgi:hypothetical protein